MDPAEVMLSGFIGVAADSYWPLYCTSGFSLYNATGSPIIYFQINNLHPQKHYYILPVSVCPFASISSACFFLIQKIRSSKKIAIGGKSHA